MVSRNPISHETSKNIAVASDGFLRAACTMIWATRPAFVPALANVVLVGVRHLPDIMQPAHALCRSVRAECRRKPTRGSGYRSKMVGQRLPLIGGLIRERMSELSQ